MKRWMVLALGLSLILPLSMDIRAQDTGDDAKPAFIDENGDGIDDRLAFRHRFGRRGGMLSAVVSSNMTDEQRAALQEKINEMMASGATWEEIQNVIYTELEGFGVDVIAGQLDRLSSKLTEDQLAALTDKINALKDGGASYGEIRTAIHGELVELGVRPAGPGLGRLDRLLTEDQMTSLQAKIDAMVAEGANRGDVRTAIQEELGAMGIELPTKSGRGRFGRHGFRGRGRHAPPPPAGSGGDGSSN